MGKFKCVWEHLIPPTEQVDPALRQNRSSDERPQRLLDGPFNAIGSHGNTGAVEKRPINGYNANRDLP